MLDSFRELADDNTSGATELINRLLALCECCALGEAFGEVEEGLAMLETAQMSMPSFHAVVNILKSEFLPKLVPGEDTAEAISYLASLQQILSESGATIAVRFAERFSVPVRILTLSRSSTVILALQHLISAGLLAHLYVLESRPLNEGVKTLRDCVHDGARGTLMADAAMMEAVRQVDCVIVGADCVSADGFLLNKTGTHPLAIICRAKGVPLYVLCDSLKFSPQLVEQTCLEARPPSELVALQPDDSFEVWNTYFEWTPIDLISAFITERGSFTPDQVSGIAAEEVTG